MKIVMGVGKHIVKIFVISLKRCTDRRRDISQQLGQYGIEFEFIDAIDGAKLTTAQRNAMVHKKLTYDLPGQLSTGEICCAASHALAYEKIVTEQIPHAIIIEDDAIIPDDRFKSVLDAKILEKTTADMVMLFHDYTYVLPWHKAKPFFEHYSLYKPIIIPNSTVCYYLTLAGAKKLYNATRLISNVADWPQTNQTLDISAIYPCFIHHPGYDDYGAVVAPKEKIQLSLIEQKRGNNSTPTTWKNILNRIPVLLIRIFYIAGLGFGMKKIFSRIFLKRLR